MATLRSTEEVPQIGSVARVERDDGAAVAVRCVATNIDVVPDLPSDQEAAWILAEARRIFGEEGADPAEVG